MVQAEEFEKLGRSAYASYRMTFSGWLGQNMTGGCMVLISGLVTAGAFTFISRSLSNGVSSEGVLVSVCAGLALVVGVVLGIIGLLTLLTTVPLFRFTVTVYPNGLLIRRNTTSRVILWDDVAEFYERRDSSYGSYDTWGLIESPLRPPVHTFTLTLKRGDTFEFTDMFEEVDDLGVVIRNGITNPLSSRTRALLEQNGAVDFGVWSITREGITERSSDHTLEWVNLKSITVERGKVTFYQKPTNEKWKSVSVSMIPNVYVFLGQVQELSGQTVKWGEYPMLDIKEID